MNTVPSPQRSPGISAWSVLSMLLGLGLCPFVTIFAIPFGVLGLREVRRTRKFGRTAAWIGIALGAVVTPLTTLGMLWWNDAVRIPMLYGPYEAIVAGQRGDVQGFEAGFTQTQDVPVESIGRFLNELHSRWGLLEEVTQDQSREAVYRDDESAVRIPYRFSFEGGIIPGEAEFVLNRRSDAGFEFVYRFAWVRIGTDEAQEAAVGWPPTLAEQQREPLPPRTRETDATSIGDADSE
ncbi:MAG: DUF4190 domain-containing protein [Phycisphaerales bacterium]|nr:DUF4190 domain-containing protein [Phycisphaerales bacterium]